MYASVHSFTHFLPSQLGISIGTGTSLQLENLQVRNIDDITSTFLSVSGETTTNVTIENLSLVDNERIPDSSEWNGIRVFDGASVKIFNYRLLDTVSMYSALQVDNAASASVNGLQATSVSGAVSPVSWIDCREICCQ